MDLFRSPSLEEGREKTREYPHVILKEIQGLLKKPLNELCPSEAFEVKMCLLENVEKLDKAIVNWIVSYEQQIK